MKYLIQFKDDQEKAVHNFGVLPDGGEGEDQPDDDQVFYWLTQEEWAAIGEGFDGGDWIVLRCACDECWEGE